MCSSIFASYVTVVVRKRGLKRGFSLWCKIIEFSGAFQRGVYDGIEILWSRARYAAENAGKSFERPLKREYSAGTKIHDTMTITCKQDLLDMQLCDKYRAVCLCKSVLQCGKVWDRREKRDGNLVSLCGNGDG